MGRASYLFNATIAGIEQADALLMVGTNPRQEAPVLNARIRKRWRAGNSRSALIGEKADLTYAYDYLGAGPETLAELMRRDRLRQGFKAAERPMVIVGQGALARPDGAAMLPWRPRPAHRRRRGQGRLERLQRAAYGGFARRRARCRLRAGRGRPDAPPRWRRRRARCVYSCSAPTRSTCAPAAFVVYQGTHGDGGAHRADVILPGAAYTEKSGIYVNTEGRVQMAQARVFPPGDAREDWAILRALSDHLGHTLPYDSLAPLRGRCTRRTASRRLDTIDAGDRPLAQLAALGGTPDKAPFASAVADFYLTNPIARASAVMAECSALARRRRRTHGGGVAHGLRKSGPGICGR